MVVDDQDSNANHETPFPSPFPEQGTTPSSEDDTGAGTTPRPCHLNSPDAGRAVAAARPPPCDNRHPTPDAVPDRLAP
ncbi:hypothetical protein GCM10010415_00980 [Streptomyces atrovirens]